MSNIVLTFVESKTNPNTMSKQLNCQDLMDFLRGLQSEGYELSEIDVNYRNNHNSDVKKVTRLEEDLYDKWTNSKLTSIMFLTKS